MTDEPSKDAGRSPWDELKRMADEVKVKLHLAGMEAKDRWKTIEPKLHELQAKVESQSEKAADAVQAQVGAMVESVRHFVDELRTDLEARRAKDDAAPDDKPR